MWTVAPQDRRRAPSLVAWLALLVAWLAPAPVAAADEPRYGVQAQRDVPVELRDGTVLRADVYSPADPGGRPAEGRFPVLLTQTPYTKTAMAAAGPGEGGTSADPGFFVPRGYIVVLADVRGTGGSTGAFRLLGPPEGEDGAQLVRWAAALPRSNGRVGLTGASYMGTNQLTTAAAVGPGSALKAIFPIAAATDVYRDFAWQGGVANAESDVPLALLYTGLNAIAPAIENGEDPGAALEAALAHAPGALDPNARLLMDGLTGGPLSFDGPFWRERAPQEMLDRVVANGVPAFLVGGWLDVFQRGALLNYSGLQNAWAGRPPTDPMRPGARPTGRYQLLMGPWHHLNVGEGLDLRPIQLRWFDRWLKDEPTAITRTSTPLHLFELGAGGWRDARRFPLESARVATFYLAPGRSGSAPHSLNDGTLSRRPPKAGGADSLRFVGASSPCSRQTAQWSVGTLVPEPCLRDDRAIQTGPGALTYTTKPFAEPALVAGPISASIELSAERPDALVVATIEDVAPDGTSTPLTAGSLLASHRALDPVRTWRGPDGRVLRPYHPHTRESLRPLVPGEVVRLDVEVFPTFARLAAGHRLRLTLTSSDTPHLLPSAPQLADLAGGKYRIQRRAGALSTLQVPLAPVDAYAEGCGICGQP